MGAKGSKAQAPQATQTSSQKKRCSCLEGVQKTKAAALQAKQEDKLLGASTPVKADPLLVKHDDKQANHEDKSLSDHMSLNSLSPEKAQSNCNVEVLEPIETTQKIVDPQTRGSQMSAIEKENELIVGGNQALPPAWCRGEIEAPAGEKSMGSYTVRVYTSEQQARLGVDEYGSKVETLAARPGNEILPIPQQSAASMRPDPLSLKSWDSAKASQGGGLHTAARAAARVSNGGVLPLTTRTTYGPVPSPSGNRVIVSSGSFQQQLLSPQPQPQQVFWPKQPWQPQPTTSQVLGVLDGSVRSAGSGPFNSQVMVTRRVSYVQTNSPRGAIQQSYLRTSPAMYQYPSRNSSSPMPQWRSVQLPVTQQPSGYLSMQQLPNINSPGSSYVLPAAVSSMSPPRSTSFSLTSTTTVTPVPRL